MTGSGRWVGTLDYIAPEQIRGVPIDARADVYALGCLLFYVLTGVAPYRRDTDEATLFAHLHDPPPDARELVARRARPRSPTSCARALEKDPDDRFPSAGDLGRAALRRGRRRPGAAARAHRRPRRRGARAARPTTRPPVRGARSRPTEVAPARGRDAGAAAAAGRRRARCRCWPARRSSSARSLLLGGGDDQPGDAPRHAAGRRRPPPGAPAGGAPKAAAPVKVDPRPNSLAFARGRVWVTSVRSGRLIGLPADGKGGAADRSSCRGTAGRRRSPPGFGSLWVINGDQSRLRAPRRRPRAACRPTRSSAPASRPPLAVGEGAVWVGRRAVKRTDPPSARAARSPRAPARCASRCFGEEGVADVADRRRLRVGGQPPPRPRHPASTPRRWTAAARAVGGGQHRVTYGAGQVWVTNYDDGTVTQNNRALTNRVTRPGHRPRAAGPRRTPAGPSGSRATSRAR